MRVSPQSSQLALQADKLVGSADAYLVIDDTALSKKGMHSVGVAPQYASTLGKTANCQTLVSLTLAGEIEERAIVDHEPVQIPADDRGLHAVVEDFAGNAADRLQSGDMTAQDGLQVLMHDEARPNQSRVAEHEREQPDDASDAGLVGKFDNELREVDLRLFAGRRLEADLESRRPRRPQIAQQVGDRRVSALIPTLLELAP
jgi:DDE superfamily endonuclease